MRGVSVRLVVVNRWHVIMPAISMIDVFWIIKILVYRVAVRGIGVSDIDVIYVSVCRVCMTVLMRDVRV